MKIINALLQSVINQSYNKPKWQKEHYIIIRFVIY